MSFVGNINRNKDDEILVSDLCVLCNAWWIPFCNAWWIPFYVLIKFLSGTHMTTSGQLFNYLQPVMNTMIDMMGLYHNYPNIVELFLEIYCEAAKRMLCYLTTSASRHLYQQTINLIQVYAHHNQVMVYLYTALL